VASPRPRRASLDLAYLSIRLLEIVECEPGTWWSIRRAARQLNTSPQTIQKCALEILAYDLLVMDILTDKLRSAMIVFAFDSIDDGCVLPIKAAAFTKVFQPSKVPHARATLWGNT
jgi:hypothetical protein